MYEVKPDKQH